jgi:hypothetical protein
MIEFDKAEIAFFYTVFRKTLIDRDTTLVGLAGMAMHAAFHDRILLVSGSIDTPTASFVGQVFDKGDLHGPISHCGSCEEKCKAKN